MHIKARCHFSQSTGAKAFSLQDSVPLHFQEILEISVQHDFCGHAGHRRKSGENLTLLHISYVKYFKRIKDLFFFLKSDCLCCCF